MWTGGSSAAIWPQGLPFTGGLSADGIICALQLRPKLADLGPAAGSLLSIELLVEIVQKIDMRIAGLGLGKIPGQLRNIGNDDAVTEHGLCPQQLERRMVAPEAQASILEWLLSCRSPKSCHRCTAPRCVVSNSRCGTPRRRSA